MSLGAQIVAAIERIGVQIRWLDKVTGNIAVVDYGRGGDCEGAMTAKGMFMLTEKSIKNLPPSPVEDNKICIIADS